MRSFLFALLAVFLAACGAAPKTSVIMVPESVPTLYSGFSVQLGALVAYNQDRDLE